MQSQDLEGLQWPEDGAALHQLSAVESHDDDFFPAVGNVQGDEANTDGQPRRQQRRNKVKAQTDSLRNQVARLRLEIRELRAEPQQGSVMIWDMMDRFWYELRSLAEIHPKANKSLQGLRDQIQSALDEFGPKRASYDEKEDDLIHLEYQLENKEMHLYELESRLERGSPVALSDSHSKNSSPNSPFIKDESSPAYLYLSRVGDANIVSERLMELTEERAQYLEIEQSRNAMGFPLFQPNADFLARFDVEYADHLEQLREINEDIEKLKPDMGFLPPGGVNEWLPAGEGFNSGMTPVRVQSDRQERVVPDQARRRKSDGELVTLSFDRQSNRQSICRWISERFNISLLDPGRYDAIFDNADLDDGSWWRLVQECWRSGRTAGLLRLSPGEGSATLFPGSATSSGPRGQKPSRRFNDGPGEFEIFSHYPVDPDSRDQSVAPDISWKSRAQSNYFDGPLFRSNFDEESLSFHADSEGSLRL